MNPDAMCECGDRYWEHDAEGCRVIGCDCEEFDSVDESPEIRTRGESDER